MVAPHGVCHTCSLPGCDEPVHYDDATDRVHDFCSLSHAQEAMDHGVHPSSNKRRQGQVTKRAHNTRTHAHTRTHGSRTHYSCRHPLPGVRCPAWCILGSGLLHLVTHARGCLLCIVRRVQAAPGNQCALYGCSAPRFFDQQTGHTHDFCGRTHAKTAASRGYVPPPQGMPAQGVTATFRGRHGEPDYTLSVLTNEHSRYRGIKQQFLQGWLHPGHPPTVMRIIQVRTPRSSLFALLLSCSSRFDGFPSSHFCFLQQPFPASTTTTTTTTTTRPHLSLFSSVRSFSFSLQLCAPALCSRACNRGFSRRARSDPHQSGLAQAYSDPKRRDFTEPEPCFLAFFCVHSHAIVH